MPNKLVISDLDSTIFDFAPHFENWAINTGHDIKRGVIEQTYHFADMFDHPIDIDEFLISFFECDQTMGSFSALEHTIEPMNRLHEAGYSFVAITACNNREGLAELRAKNLKEVLGFEFDDVHITGYNQPKAEFLKRYDPAIWVEDHRFHAIDGAALGHTTFLIDHPYNQGDGPFMRV